MKSFFTCMILFGTFTVFGQTYSDNREKFVKEFQKQISEYGRGKSKSFAKNELPVMLLESGEFPDAYFSKMVSTCNLLVEKRFGTYPEVFNYVYSVYSFVKNKQSKDSYEAWHNSVDKLIDNRTKSKLTDFMEFSAGFFSERRIASSSDFDWFYIGGIYNFEYTKNAVINFSGGNLVCRVIKSRDTNKEAVIDSINITNTAGTYNPTNQKWEGTGGKITWERVGLDPQKTFAELSGFNFSMRKSVVVIDTVTLTTPYFDAPVKGRLTDRAFKFSREEDRVFPQFMSFEKKLVINNIVPEVDYSGGYEMKGAKFYGTGSNAVPSQIVLKQKGAPFIIARSPQIIVDEKQIRIGRAETTLHFNTGDSLYHPGADFLYNLEEKSVQISRTKSGIGQASFQDSYHQLEMYVPRITWELGSDELVFTYEFGTSQEQKMARFESKAYFDERLYDYLQGLSRVHPLVALANYSYKYDEDIMTSGTAASALGMSLEQAAPSLIQMSNYGFINYDTEQGLVHINDKLITFVRAKAGNLDYDNIVFVSDLRPKKAKQLEGMSDFEIKKDPYLSYIDSLFRVTNQKRLAMKQYATMDMTTMNMNIEAIDNVDISVHKNIVVIPDGNEVLVRKNRDFNFSGWLYAGKAEIKAVAANFEYEPFKVKLLQTDETVLRVTPMKKEHGPGLVKMVSSIHGISGELLIDDPGNKSGKNEEYAEFPKLVSSSKSKIFYNSKDVFRGAYDSTRFYFTVDPFELDSLHSFPERLLRLDGELTSAGIFPVFRKEVKLMPDYSFGFTTEAPAGGYPFYGTKAKYENRILLSHNGLQGAGTINFIKSTSETLPNTLLSFLPDSTLGVVNFVNLPSESGVQFPPVTSDEAYITYVPRNDLLKASSMPGKDLDFFEGEAKLRGTLAIRPDGMTGKGLMEFERATLISRGFSYKRFDIDADTSSFSLKNDSKDVTEDPLAFKTDNVSSHVSFKERKGEFNSNEGESEVFFPVNQYLCKMDKFTWFMDDYEIEMERQEDQDIAINQGVDLKGPNFYSTHPKQDSLQFRAPKANFNVKKKVIRCDEVEYIDVADARIYPDSMKVVIRKKAKMDKFMNANIVANYITKYHKFEEAEVQINARRDYDAKGVYPYYDRDSNVYYVAMNDIKPDTSFQTRASGKITQTDNFKLSPQFDYYGDVSIRAANPLILFSGATRINHSCEKFEKNWMSFSSEIDPKNIQIPVAKDMKNLEGGAISAGIVWRDSPSTDSIALYPTFLSALVDPNDPIVMTANGFLQYNDMSKEFQIGSKEKLINRSEKGNYIALHTESCSMNGDGEISLGMDFGDVDIDAVGVVNYNQSTGETSMNITARFDMALDKGMMQGVADRINEIEGLKPGDFNSTTLEQAILTWDDAKTAEEIKSKFVIDNEFKKVPDGLNKSMTFTGIRLSSFDNNNQTTGLITNTQSAVLVNMYGKPVMKYVPFRAFFQQIYSGGGGDKFTLLVDIPGGRDYLMNYTPVKKDGLLKIVTGDTELSTTLSEMKEDKRKSKNFKYEVSSQSIYRTQLFELFGE